MPAVLAPALVSLGVGSEVATGLAGVIFAGLSLILSILFAPKVPKPEDGRTPFKQPVPSRIRIIGKRRSGGAYMLYHSWKGDTFYGVQAICDGPVNEFSRFYLHDDVVTLDGNRVLGISSDGPNRYGDSKIHIYWRLGVNPETSYVGSSPWHLDDTIWSEDHRGDGIASALLIAADAGKKDQSSRFPFGIPQLSVEVDATPVFDPRASGQDWADPDTWSFAGNDNAVLQIAWFLTAPIKDGGLGLDFEEAFAGDLAALAAQADVCDEAVSLKGGGTERRYRSCAMYRRSDDPSDVLAAMIGACDGFVVEAGDGSIIVKAGKWDDDDFAVTITDRHIISLNVKRFRPDEDEVTGVIVKYNSVAHEHTTIDAPVWPRDAYQGGDDKRVRTIEVINCPSGTQAQRLSKRVAVYEMATVSFSAVLNLYGMLLLDKRGCTLDTSDDPDLAGVKVRLTRVELNIMDGTVEIDGTVFDPEACDAWDAATEEGPLQPAVSVPIDDANSIPDDLSASAGEVDGAIYVDLQFDPGEEPAHDFTVRWRLADIGGGVPGGWTTADFPEDVVEQVDDTHWIVTITGLPAGVLDMQIIGNASPAYSATTTVDTRILAPGRPSDLSAMLSGANVDIDWTAPDSVAFDHARVYRAASGAGFGLASDISGEIAGTPSEAMNYTDVAPGSGSYDYWVTAESATDAASLPRGPVTVVVP